LNNKLSILLTAWALFLAVPPAAAQPGKPIPASLLLDSLAIKYQVNFSYNHSLLHQLELPRPLPSDSLAGQLRFISSQAPLQFRETSKDYFLVIPVRSSIRFDARDVQSGEPLLYLYLTLNQAEKKLLVPLNDSYEITQVFPTDSILLESTFYQPVRLRVADLKTEGERILFMQDTVYLNKVVVYAYICSGISSRPGSHSVEISMKDLGPLAGETDGDILQVLKAIPGIRSPDGKPGSLVLRGGTYDQNLVYFDDIPIYHTGHFFGTFSPYNPGIVDKITVHRSTLPARWGGRVGGLIDIRTSDEIPVSATYDVLANTVYGGFQVKTPVGKKTGLTFSARSSYPGTYLSPKLKAFSDLNFQGSKIAPQFMDNVRYLEGDGFDLQFRDMNGKLTFDAGANHRVALSFMHIADNFGYRYVSSNRDLVETESSVMNNAGITGRWNGKFGKKLSASAGLTGAALKIKEVTSEKEAGVFIRGTHKTNAIKDLRLTSGLVYAMNEKSQATLGYEITRHLLDAYELRQNGNGQAPEQKRESKAAIHSFYTSYQQDIGHQFTATLGVHADYYTPLKKVFADPRLLLTWFTTQSFFLKASAGRSHQYLKRRLNNDFDDFKVVNQFWFLANVNDPVLEGNQVMAGAVLNKRGWLIDLELFGKQTNGVARGSGPDPFATGSLSTIGSDLLVKKRWNVLESWITYSLGKTLKDFEGEQTAIYYNQAHALNASVMLPLERWNFALSWVFMSGMPVVVPGPDQLKPDRPGASDSLSISYTGNFPVQHQLDLSATYRFSRKGARWNGVIGLSVLNLYNRKNIINIFQNDVDTRYPYRYGVGFSPNLQVKISF
jgi:hypothetical protein